MRLVDQSNGIFFFFSAPSLLIDLSLWLASGSQPAETNARPNSLIFPSSVCTFLILDFLFFFFPFPWLHQSDAWYGSKWPCCSNSNCRWIFIKLIFFYIVQPPLRFNSNYFDFFTSTSCSLSSGLCPTSRVDMSRIPLSLFFLIFGSRTTCFLVFQHSATPTDFRLLIQFPLDSDVFQGHVVSTWLPCNTIFFLRVLLFSVERLCSGESRSVIFQSGKIWVLPLEFGKEWKIMTSSPCLVSSVFLGVYETDCRTPAIPIWLILCCCTFMLHD